MSNFNSPESSKPSNMDRLQTGVVPNEGGIATTNQERPQEDYAKPGMFASAKNKVSEMLSKAKKKFSKS